MYINFKLAKEKGFTVGQIVALQMIKQNKFEDLSESIETFVALDLPWLEDNNFVEYIKSKKKNQNKFELIRLSKKGAEVLDTLETAEITSDSLKIFDWIKSIYLASGKEIGNEKKTKMFIAQFSAESGIVRNELAFLINTFINDEKEMEYSRRLQYLFFKGESVFSVKFDLHSSRLYQYYLKHKEFMDTKFQEL